MGAMVCSSLQVPMLSILELMDGEGLLRSPRKQGGLSFCVMQDFAHQQLWRQTMILRNSQYSMSDEETR